MTEAKGSEPRSQDALSFVRQHQGWFSVLFNADSKSLRQSGHLPWDSFSTTAPSIMDDIRLRRARIAAGGQSSYLAHVNQLEHSIFIFKIRASAASF